MGQHGWQLATSSDAHEICIHGGVHSLYDFPCELLTLIAHVFFPFCTPAKKKHEQAEQVFDSQHAAVPIVSVVFS